MNADAPASLASIAFTANRVAGLLSRKTYDSLESAKLPSDEDIVGGSAFDEKLNPILIGDAIPARTAFRSREDAIAYAESLIAKYPNVNILTPQGQLDDVLFAADLESDHRFFWFQPISRRVNLGGTGDQLPKGRTAGQTVAALYAILIYVLPTPEAILAVSPEGYKAYTDSLVIADIGVRLSNASRALDANGRMPVTFDDLVMGLESDSAPELNKDASKWLKSLYANLAANAKFAALAAFGGVVAFRKALQSHAFAAHYAPSVTPEAWESLIKTIDAMARKAGHDMSAWLVNAAETRMSRNLKPAEQEEKADADFDLGEAEGIDGFGA